MIAWVSGPRLDSEAFRELLVQEGVESVLPCALRVDLARHLAASMDAPAAQGREAGGRVTGRRLHERAVARRP